jgi:amino acid transporter
MESNKQNEIRKYLKITGFLIVANILMFTFFTDGLGGLKENLIIALYTVVICYTVVAFILGAVVALFPFNKLHYKKKYWRASMLSNLIIQIGFFVSLMWLCIVTIFDK